MKYCLEIYNPEGQKIKACKTETRGRVVEGKHQSYRMRAASAGDRDHWIQAIRSGPLPAEGPRGVHMLSRVEVTEPPFWGLD